MVKSRSKTKASSCKGSSKRPRLEPSCFVINPIYRDPEFAKNFRVDLKVDPSIITKVEDELINYPSWNRKENDLYSLLQTPDLQTLNAAKYPAIRGFWYALFLSFEELLFVCIGYEIMEFLCGEMREWLGKTSDIELLPQVDSTGSCYASTDCLLPHSDQVENRRFAFVYYFTEEPWKESFGGQLNVADLTAIFSGQLLTEGAKESMRKVFREEKELLIKSAFQETFSNEILDELDKVEWMAELDVEKCTSESVDRFLKTIRSLSMMEFVREVTGFEYQDPQTITWSYRLTPGCYTVLGDEDAEQFIKDGMSVDFWVLRCPPTIGAVAMVHREKDVFPFLKYVNHLAKSEPIYVFGFSVYGGKSSASE
ncbi:unnamed protein product [Nippostrongylus brasiliensis]|uniref:2OG-FeII_Oxy_4 domain-containing protein n=1 Tax=Nippostrongylus brasiliensis TaxID=27835 RepID=A0A0N4YQ14_NIPBR|nr:unnamed protein product [Nippostrongylus brasiliensis]